MLQRRSIYIHCEHLRENGECICWGWHGVNPFLKLIITCSTIGEIV